MGTHPIFESDFDCLTEMATVDDALNELVETKRTLSELRHTKPAQLKAEWLQTENAKIDKMLSEVKNHGAQTFFSNNQDSLQTSSTNCSLLVSQNDNNISDTEHKTKAIRIKEILDSRKNDKNQNFTKIDGVPDWLIDQYNDKNFVWRKFC